MADQTKVDLVKIKFPDVVITKDIKKRGRTFRHAVVQTTINPICAENEAVESTMIRNLSPDTVWIGDRSLIVGINGNGWPLYEEDTITIDKSFGEIFAMTENGTAVLVLIEE